MEPFKKDIKIRRGDTKEIFFRVRTKVWDNATSTYIPGPYKDLTGYTVTSQVRANSDATEVLATFAVTLGEQTDEVNGRGAVLLKLSAAQTAAIPTSQASGVYDVQFTEPDADVFTYLEGGVTFVKDVTR